MNDLGSGFARTQLTKTKDILSNAEAKSTARQLRGCLFKMIEHAIDNEWQEVADGADVVKTLAKHLQGIEKSYKR